MHNKSLQVSTIIIIIILLSLSLPSVLNWIGVSDNRERAEAGHQKHDLQGRLVSLGVLEGMGEFPGPTRAPFPFLGGS